METFQEFIEGGSYFFVDLFGAHACHSFVTRQFFLVFRSKRVDRVFFFTVHEEYLGVCVVP